MKRLTNISILLIFFSVMFYAGCKDTITSEQIDNKVIPASNVSYAEYIQPVLDLKCATAGCHDDITKAHGLSLTSWSNTVADPNVVFPKHPDNSSLVWAAEGNPAVSPMPPLGSPYKAMTADQVRGLKTWIQEGALNN